MEERYILHPGVVVSLDGEELRVMLGDDVQFSTSDVELALAAFSALLVPVTKLEVARAMPDVDVAELLEVCEAAGIIVPATASVLDQPAAILGMMSEVVALAHRIAGDVAGRGPRDTEEARRAQADLQAILIRLAQVEVTLRASRRDYLSSQLRKLGIEGATGLKLHLGASRRSIRGWIGIDVAPAELAMDLRWGLPFADGTVDRVFLSHVLEHLSQEEAQRLLGDVHRTLRVGGLVRVIVPSFRRYAEAYVNRDARFFARQAEHWDWAADMTTDLERILRYAAGADADPRSFMAAHRFGYDFETLARCLGEAGFATVVESRYMASVHPELRIDDQTAHANVELDGQAFSLFVEATKERP